MDYELPAEFARHGDEALNVPRFRPVMFDAAQSGDQLSILWLAPAPQIGSDGLPDPTMKPRMMLTLSADAAQELAGALKKFLDSL